MMVRSIDASCFAFSTFVVSRKVTVRGQASYVRRRPILMRWCSRHSPQTQPRMYAAFVPCWRSSRRVAVSAPSDRLTTRRRFW
jgi:hypothetical protein